jgi:hypothetical protein
VIVHRSVVTSRETQLGISNLGLLVKENTWQFGIGSQAD